MTPEVIAILAVGAALAGLQLAQNRSLRQEIAELRKDLADVDRRLARIEGAVLGPWRPEPEGDPQKG